MTWMGLITSYILYNYILVIICFSHPLLLTLGAHAQRGLRYLVCLSVRRLANLAVQGTGRPMTATNHFRVARSLILIGRFS